jgi:hypothetical protein
MNFYFLGSNSLPWWILGVSDASGMFDITGTMWLVYILFVYGFKSVWMPWIWPTFNQIFLMVYLSIWLRKSNVMTGAQWIETRFGNSTGDHLSHLSVVIFALVSVIGFIAYAFKGIGKLAAIFFPWQLSPETYAIILMLLTAIYAAKGGMFNVLVGVVWQTSLVLLPMTLITKEYPYLLWVCMSILITSIILKFSWWNRLDELSKQTLPSDFNERILGTVYTPPEVPSTVTESVFFQNNLE